MCSFFTEVVEGDVPPFPLQDFYVAQSVDFTSAPVALRLDVGKEESERLSPVELDSCDKPSHSEESLPACLSNPKLLKVKPKKNKSAIKVGIQFNFIRHVYRY